MRILFTRFPYASAKGGAEHQTEWLMAGLRERGHEVSFLGSCPVILRRTEAIGVARQQLSIGLPPVTMALALSFLWRKRSMQQKLIRVIEAMPTKPDAIVMLSLTEKILLTPWASDHGIRVFWIEHDRIGKWLTKNPWLGALKRAATKATIICVSELSRKLYVELGFQASRVVAIPNGVPPPLLPTTIHYPPSTIHFAIGCIARFSPEKGIDVLIHALAGLPECDLTIVGTGPEEAYLRSLIREDTERIGMQRIVLAPSVPDLEAFYSSIDVLVLPSSDHDPFGLVAAEAMMRGIPTVVTDACGIAGYLTDGHDACIVEAGSPESLKNALTKLLNADLRQRLGEQGKRTATSRFSLPVMIELYEKALRVNR